MSGSTSLSTALESYAAAQQVAPRWFFGALAWVKATGEQTGGQLSLVELVVPPGWASPLHLHHTEDELLYVIEGHLTVVVGDQRLSLGPGGYGFGPREIPHAFRAEGEQPARNLLLTTSGDLANFVLEASEPATAPILPEPPELDMAKIAALSAKYNSQLLGPFPE
ncbi:MAG: cupin domain-containing protein [Candidatus Dormibacteraeota bacterium]|nr:cupin domain-containing protein [Candidatus Dormibacteraeota bacterium]